MWRRPWRGRVAAGFLRGAEAGLPAGRACRQSRLRRSRAPAAARGARLLPGRGCLCLLLIPGDGGGNPGFAHGSRFARRSGFLGGRLTRLRGAANGPAAGACLRLVLFLPFGRLYVFSVLSIFVICHSHFLSLSVSCPFRWFLLPSVHGPVSGAGTVSMQFCVSKTDAPASAHLRVSVSCACCVLTPCGGHPGGHLS